VVVGGRGTRGAGHVGVLLLGVGLGGRPELLPGVAAVTGDVQPAAGAAAGQSPRFPPHLPEAGEDHLGVGGVEADVRGAGVLVLVQHLLPGPTAVGRAVDAAFGVGAEGVAEDGGEGDIGVGGVDDHRADLAVLLPDALPRLAGVGGPVDAVALDDVAAEVG